MDIESSFNGATFIFILLIDRVHTEPVTMTDEDVPARRGTHAVVP